MLLEIKGDITDTFITDYNIYKWKDIMNFREWFIVSSYFDRYSKIQDIIIIPFMSVDDSDELLI
jgi:hypothetical protein